MSATRSVYVCNKECVCVQQGGVLQQGGSRCRNKGCSFFRRMGCVAVIRVAVAYVCCRREVEYRLRYLTVGSVTAVLCFGRVGA